ncbi:D-alanyl-D-alanine carboxypeptidase/D-alanyl-D-alanine-endopeptidase [Maribellus sediminis]|uniref:D-alanyl-D-alanine carboxypeptidase/D-alanyl-D-alanine endopeptidase n=1 Tax=Maribellus sediminis TaxID=2696285 RepID=UPI001430885C|nr:D-alanyl-D-alanine carboxypeptidase/D-alanyl-D-alanine-endopeptidase [Maribellus sediminis]
MKRIAVIVLLVLFASSAFAQLRALAKKKHNVNRTLKQVVEYPEFTTAGFAFLAIDINSGAVVAQYNADKCLKPASTQKLISTATVLELLGPDCRFETTIEYTGEIDRTNKILHGDIIIKGGGDPTLGSKYFDTTKDHQFLNDWVTAIKAAGIDSVAGRIIADDRIYSNEVPPGWSWSDMGNYYGAGPCGLSIFDNYYSLYFDTNNFGDTVRIAKIKPEIAGLTFDNTITADSIIYDDSYIYGAPYTYNRYIRGHLPIHRNSFEVKGSLPDPALTAAIALDSSLKLERVGTERAPTTVELEKVNPGKATKVLYTTYSPTLSEIIEQTNVHSVNLFAEHCLIQAGVAMGAAPETEIAADSMVSFLEKNGVDTRGMQIFDGSGLSHYNAISPRQMVALLTHMKKESPYFETFFHSMANAGETGTIRNMFKGTAAERQLRAKSGTINKVKAYAGYVTSESGREIAFSMVVNNYSCSSSEARDQLEKLMVSLAELKK